MQPYERFEAWKLTHQLVLATYRATAHFPAAERYGLTSQARRAAFSAAANIVEGSAKRGHREFRRFLDTAIGSLSELGYAFRVAKDLGFLETELWEETERLRDHAARVTWGLYRAVSSADRPSARPPVRP